eukprot:m.55122 g.55122  ORF g.55122 m.55122 type:complete len:614 (+) comp11115_c0_seq2:108-1949(+)
MAAFLGLKLSARQRAVVLRVAATVGVAGAVVVVRYIYALKKRARNTKRYIKMAQPQSRTLRFRSRGNKRVAVLGGGVSGLTAAWRLKSKCPDLDVHVFEANDEVGGLLNTQEGREGIRIETGPRTLRTSTQSAAVAIALIEDLGLGQLLMWADKATRGRRFVYDYKAESLEELPTKFTSLIAFVFKHRVLFAIIRDIAHALGIVTASNTNNDNRLTTMDTNRGSGSTLLPVGTSSRDTLLTCDGFFRSHFSGHLADQFLSALVHGIFSGDSRQLLLRYAFPAMWNMKRAYGSLVIGSILEPFMHLAESYQSPPLPSCATTPSPQTQLLKRAKKERVAVLKGGMSTLITGLWDKLTGAGVHIHTSNPIDRLEFDENALEDKGSVVVYSNGSSLMDVDCVISTLPTRVLESLLTNSLTHLNLTQECYDRVAACVEKLGRINTLTIVVATYIFPATTFAAVVGANVQPGFGFLMPRNEDRRGSLLGVVYDSCVYPELGGHDNVVLTAMIGGAEEENQSFVRNASEQELLEYGLDCLQTYLNLRIQPQASRLSRWVDSIPQFDRLYHSARHDLEYCGNLYMPWLFIGGKAFGYGVGVNDSIMTSTAIADAVVKVLGK